MLDMQIIEMKVSSGHIIIKRKKREYYKYHKRIIFHYSRVWNRGPHFFGNVHQDIFASRENWAIFVYMTRGAELG